jgi:hypothetical protein
MFALAASLKDALKRLAEQENLIFRDGELRRPRSATEIARHPYVMGAHSGGSSGSRKQFQEWKEAGGPVSGEIESKAQKIIDEIESVNRNMVSLTAEFKHELVGEYDDMMRQLEKAGHDYSKFSQDQLRQFAKTVTKYRALLEAFADPARAGHMQEAGITGDMFGEGGIEKIAELTEMLRVLKWAAGDIQIPVEGGIDTDKMDDAREKIDAMTKALKFQLGIVFQSDAQRARSIALHEEEQLIIAAGYKVGGEQHQQLIDMRSSYEDLNAIRDFGIGIWERWNALAEKNNQLRDDQKVSLDGIVDKLKAEQKVLSVIAKDNRTVAQLQEEMIVLDQARALGLNLTKNEMKEYIQQIRELIRANQDLVAAGEEDPLAGFYADLEDQQNTIGMTTEALARYRFEVEAMRTLNASANDDRIVQLMSEYDLTAKLRKESKGWSEDMLLTQEQFAQAVTDAAMAVITGSMTIEQAFLRLVQLLIEMIIQAMIYRAIMGALTGGAGAAVPPPTGGGGFEMPGGTLMAAKGMAFSERGTLEGYAYGGVVDRATQFNSRSGRGVMGEAGAEAIMPLTRMPDGTLGVQAEGSGGKAVVVNMNITTSDADSFRKSRKQITRELTRGIRTQQT